MIPILTHPFALLAAAAIPVLVGIYFLRNRLQKKPVSSLMLWAGLTRLQEGGSVIKRLQLPWLFLLELLALLFLLLAALDPRVPAHDRLRPLLIVLDDSASMLAHVSENKMVRESAQEAILKTLRATPFQSVRLILAGQHPQLLDHAMVVPAEVERALSGWTCRATEADLTAAVALAREMGGTESLILVVTDHKPVEPPETGQLRWLSVGQSLANIGFTGVGRTVGGRSDRCGVELVNFSTTPALAQLGVVHHLNGQLRQDQRTLTLEPGKTERVVVEAPIGTADMEFSLGDDALAVDNHLLVIKPEPVSVSVKTHLTDKGMANWVDRAVAASGMAAKDADGPTLVFESGEPLDSLTGDVWSCVIHQPTNAQAWVGPFVAESSHPLLDGLSFDGLVWGASTNVSLPGTPIVMAGNVTLISEEEPVPGRYRVHIQLQPSVSSVQHTPLWPSLICNLLQWRATGRQGRFDPNAHVGQQVSVPVGADVPSVNVAAPDGTQSTLKAGRGQLALELDLPGLYEIGDANKGTKKTIRVAANFLAADESDLWNCESGDWGTWQSAERIERDYVSTAWFWLVAALVTLVAHRWVMGRGAQ